MKRLLLIGFGVVLFFMSSAITPTKASAGYYDQVYTYTVKSGDTLWSIAQLYKVGKDEIIAINPALQSNETVYEGQILKVPNLSQIKALQEEVVRLTNLEREKYGLSPLVSNWEISRVARYKSNDMRDNNYFSHYSPTYGDPFVMLKDFGIQFNVAGENIAGRQDTPEKVVASWMNSDSHRAQILSTKYKRIGVGYSNGGYLIHYWTQMFTD